jgi:hypothetical protein
MGAGSLCYWGQKDSTRVTGTGTSHIDKPHELAFISAVLKGKHNPMDSSSIIEVEIKVPDPCSMQDGLF